MRVVGIIMDYTRSAGNLNRQYIHQSSDSDRQIAARQAREDSVAMKLIGLLHLW